MFHGYVIYFMYVSIPDACLVPANDYRKCLILWGWSWAAVLIQASWKSSKGSYQLNHGSSSSLLYDCPRSQKSKKDVFTLVKQVMIESELGTKLWTHQDRIDNRVFSPIVPNTNELNIVSIILTWKLFLLHIVLLCDS